MSRRKKFIRVVKRKLLKPIIYAVGLSFFIYLVVGNVAWRQSQLKTDGPHFIITRVSDQYESAEFMHLLLCIQEIYPIPKAKDELFEFVNKPYDGSCPLYLEKQLNRMNWAPQAFHVRVQKLFEMYEEYDRYRRLDETIIFLSEELKEKRLPLTFEDQIKLLIDERDSVRNQNFTEEEFEFIQAYGGIAQRLKKL